MRKFFLSLAATVLALTPSQLLASEGEHHGLPLYAQRIWDNVPITNAMLMSWLAAICVIIFAKVATRQISLVPAGIQNFAEWLVESLYNFLEGVLGSHLVKRTFWFFGGVFILILATSWIGLIPGVGTFFVNGKALLRGGNTDLNMTFALSIIFFILWTYWAITENGFIGFLAHIFAPKGKFNGFMKIFMIVIFFVVGVIEVFGIFIRPIALSLRLFGNTYAGENMLETMMNLVPKQISFLPALPFYFLELLVGLIQALVFMLLTSVFLKLICSHDEHHEEAH